MNFILEPIITIALLIIIGILLIKCASEGYEPLNNHNLAKLINKLAGPIGVKIFYYIIGAILILISIARLIFFYTD